MSEQPQTVEPVPVQLTRMEGTINLIAYQFGEVKEDIKEIRGDVSGLTGRVGAIELAQAASNGSSQSWKTWLPILAALAAVGVSAVALLLGH